MFSSELLRRISSSYWEALEVSDCSSCSVATGLVVRLCDVSVFEDTAASSKRLLVASVRAWGSAEDTRPLSGWLGCRGVSGIAEAAEAPLRKVGEAVLVRIGDLPPDSVEVLAESCRFLLGLRDLRS